MLVQGALVVVGGEGPGDQSQELAPAHGEGRGQLVVSHPLKDAQLHRSGHLLVGPVVLTQIGVLRRLGGQDGQGHDPGQSQGAYFHTPVAYHHNQTSFLSFDP